MADTQVKEATEPKAEQAPDDGVDVQEAELPEAADQAGAMSGSQIDILLDTVMPVSVRLGQVSMPVRELLQLGPGSVLKLDKQAGEPVDVFLRNVKLATGHLVVVGDQLGIRLKDIFSPGHGRQGDLETP